MTEWGEKRMNIKILPESTEESSRPSPLLWKPSCCSRSWAGAEIKTEDLLKGWFLTDKTATTVYYSYY